MVRKDLSPEELSASHSMPLRPGTTVKLLLGRLVSACVCVCAHDFVIDVVYGIL